MSKDLNSTLLRHQGMLLQLTETKGQISADELARTLGVSDDQSARKDSGAFGR